MQAFHPNLYQYFSKKDYDKVYEEIMQNLDTADFYNPDKLYALLQEFVALCRDGHSSVAREIPRKSYLNSNSKNAQSAPSKRDSTVKVFPFIFNIINEKMYVSNNCFDNVNMPVKSEIISIGSQTTQEWLQSKRKETTGERDAYRDAKISLYSSYKILNVDSCKFGYIPYGFQDTLYKTLQCKIHIMQYEKCLSQYYNYDEENEIVTFRPLDEGRIGIIEMNYFYPVKMMLPFINKALDSLKFYGAQDLIIDLRNSSGGHAESGYALIDRITNKPYRTNFEEQFFIKHAMLTSENSEARKIYTSRKYLKKNEVNAIMKAGKDTVITYQYPEIIPQEYKNKFTGRVWVLTSAFTFSAAAGLAAIVQDCRLGTVVGDETGGTQNCYGNLLFYPLSGIMDEKILRFYYLAPYIKYIRPSGDDSMYLRGVIPDIEIEPNIIRNEDLQLQTLVEIIRNQIKFP